MKIGILLCAYNCAENLQEVIKPFQRDNFVISAVSAQFKEYEGDYEDFNCENLSTLELLKKTSLGIKYLYHPKNALTEIEARNGALKPLLEENCDYIWLLDGDEFYTDKEIDNILKFIKNRSDAWFSINFKNYVFNRTTWIDGFSPSRIFRRSYFNGTNLKIKEFIEDNGVSYENEYGTIINFRELSNSTIPRYLAQVNHYSWSEPEISKKKVKYQEMRGWIVSYRWDEEKNCLEFNPEYYKNKPLPELNYE